MISGQESKLQGSETVEPFPSAKIAIVGMDAFFGECNGLDAFDRSIYEGKQHFIALPSNRWYGIEDQENLLKEYGLADGKAPLGAYIKDFEIDTLAYKIPPNEVEKLNPQQLLLLMVADRALKDAQLKEGENVAVIIAAETELSVHQLQQRWNISWQIKDGLNAEEICLPPEKIAQLETVVKDGLHHQVDIGEYLSYVSNIMASRISSLWNFNGPSFTITAGENSTFKALEVAQMLLEVGEVDAVVVGAVDLAGGLENVLLRNQLAKINTGANTLSYDQKANGWMVGEGAGAVVLKRLDTAKQESDRIYAVIDAISIGQENYTYGEFPSGIFTATEATVNQVCQQAFQIAGIQPTDINYLEVFGSGIPQEDTAEIKGLFQAYPSGNENSLNCAIGSVKANIGHTYTASGIASLIKTALCLYHRYIPATPKWNGVKTPQDWQDSPFYVATESRPWFISKNGAKRIAAINGMGIDGTHAHLIMSEEPIQKQRSSKFLQQTPYYLFPLAANNRSDLIELLTVLQKTIENTDSLAATAKLTFTTYKQHKEAKYALAILGKNKKELAREIESALKGVNNAFERGEEWQTPLGSYFTAKPLGKRGGIAYVYPAAVNAYVGIGRNIFRLFPEAHDDLILKNLGSRVADVEKLVFPRSLNKLSSRQLEGLEKELLEDSLAMFEAEILFARILTTIIRDEFQIKPQCAFGYSLGEVSMMVAQRVWSNYQAGSSTLNSSPLFGDRLSGAKNAVREYWGLTGASEFADKNFWSNYVLIATPSQVRECLKNEKRVYLTQINTPEEVLIAGETAACQRVIKALGCDSFTAPFDHVIHCEAMRSEYGELVKINTFSLENSPNLAFYSASEYGTIQLNSNAIAHSVAKGLCEQLDFPRLVNRIYQDGARIFIEAGAGGVCSRWIDKILESKEKLTVSFNRRGTDDHTSIVKALAKLLSHRVALDLSSLYNQATETTKSKATIRKVTLGGKRITETILSEENRKLFQDLSGKLLPLCPTDKPQTTPSSKESEVMNFFQALNNIKNSGSNAKNIPPSQNQQQKVPMNNVIDYSLEQREKLQSSEPNVIKKKLPLAIPQPPTTPQKIGYGVSMHNLSKSQYQKLSVNNSSVTKAHTAFLKSRQEFSKQISEIIQLQLACAQNLLNQ
ncbi:MAG: PfaB family protein [Heteroscytonema crispum UTEX LB 1556]